PVFLFASFGENFPQAFPGVPIEDDKPPRSELLVVWNASSRRENLPQFLGRRTRFRQPIRFYRASRRKKFKNRSIHVSFRLFWPPSRYRRRCPVTIGIGARRREGTMRLKLSHIAAVFAAVLGV